MGEAAQRHNWLTLGREPSNSAAPDELKGEAMDEAVVETEAPSVGEQLRAAREAKGINLEDVAAQTRIPRRHLESLENSDWDKLPAPTYTIGFAKSYASAIGLDRADIGEQLREEMGGRRAMTATTEVFEPADPARTMPKGLVFGAIGAVIVLILLMTWLNNRSLEQPDETNNVVTAEATPPPQRTAPPPTAVASGPVVLTAIAPVWFQITQKGGASLFSGMLQPGQTFAVPPTATAPLLRTGKPEALRITVGNSVAPPIGPPATTVRDVSLLPADLMKGGVTAAPAAPAPQAAPAAPPRPAPRTRRSQPRTTRSTPTQPPAGTAPLPPTTNTGE
jgi:cytoskeleton protein RodZ